MFLYFAFCVVPVNVKDKNKKMIEIGKLHKQYEWPSGLMVSALVCGSRSLGSRPCRVIELCFWANQFTLASSSLSSQEYK